MVKKVKRFIVFCLFSLIFSLLSKKQGDLKTAGINSAKAEMCCPEESLSICGGSCCDSLDCCDGICGGVDLGCGCGNDSPDEYGYC